MSERGLFSVIAFGAGLAACAPSESPSREVCARPAPLEMHTHEVLAAAHEEVRHDGRQAVLLDRLILCDDRAVSDALAAERAKGTRANREVVRLLEDTIELRPPQDGDV